MATAANIPLFNTDPNVQAQAALLQQRQALAQALMGQGLTPVDTSNRSIGGVAYPVSPMEGLAKMLQTYSGMKMSRDTIGQQAALAAQAYGNLLQKYQPGSPTYSPDQINQAEAGSLPADGMGPPDPRMMAAALSGQSPANQNVNPNNPQGIPAQILASHDAGMMNDEAFKVLTAPYAPTDATKAATQGGMNPITANQTAFSKSMSDPKIWAMQQAGLSPDVIRSAAFGEAAKTAEIERRAGQQYSNAVTGEHGMVPHIPDNANPVGTPGANGALPGVAPIPGAQPVVQGNATAQSTGSANGGIINVTLPSGAQVPMRGGQAVGALPPAQPGVKGAFTGDPAAIAAAIADMKDPQQRANAQAAFEAQMRAEGNPPKLGQSTADKTTQEENAKLMTQLPMQLQQSKQTIVGLENALGIVNKSGPGVSHAVNALAIVNNLGIPLLKDDTNGFQTLKKFLENSASTAAASNGFTGSDARFEQFKAGQPNPETMNSEALKGAIRYVLSQHDASSARAQFIMQQAQSNPDDPNAVQKAQQQWSSAYDPRVFEFSRMTPDERAKVKQGMNAQQRAQFGQKYNRAYQMGWVQ